MTVSPNQSYVVKEMQLKLAACFAAIISEIGGSAPFIESAWKNTSRVLAPAGSWRKENQQLRFWGGRGSSVTFSNARWDPDKSDIHYGAKRLAQNVEINEDENSKVIKAGTDLHVAYEESVELTNSFSSTVTEGMTLDITASVTSETTVSGSYAGVSAEEKVTASFGVDSSKSKEESKEQAEEGTKAQNLSIDFDAEAGHYYQVLVSKEHETTYQDYDIRGVMDFDTEIDFGRSTKSHLSCCKPKGTVKLVGFAGIQQYLYGYDTDHPEMKDFIKNCYGRTTNAINVLFDQRLRTVSIKGTNQASLESNAEYSVEKLGNTIPEALAYLPVKNAEDLSWLNQPMRL